MTTKFDLHLEGFEDATAILGSVLYALLLNDTLVYVGRSEAMVMRLMRHRKAGLIAFNRVMVKTVPRDLAGKQEAELIRRFKPQHNHASARPIERGEVPWPQEPVTPMERRG